MQQWDEELKIQKDGSKRQNPVKRLYCVDFGRMQHTGYTCSCHSKLCITVTSPIDSLQLNNVSSWHLRSHHKIYIGRKVVRVKVRVPYLKHQHYLYSSAYLTHFLKFCFFNYCHLSTRHEEMKNNRESISHLHHLLPKYMLYLRSCEEQCTRKPEFPPAVLDYMSQSCKLCVVCTPLCSSCQINKGIFK